MDTPIRTRTSRAAAPTRDFATRQTPPGDAPTSPLAERYARAAASPVPTPQTPTPTTPVRPAPWTPQRHAWRHRGGGQRVALTPYIVPRSPVVPAGRTTSHLRQQVTEARSDLDAAFATVAPYLNMEMVDSQVTTPSPASPRSRAMSEAPHHDAATPLQTPAERATLYTALSALVSLGDGVAPLPPYTAQPSEFALETPPFAVRGSDIRLNQSLLEQRRRTQHLVDRVVYRPLSPSTAPVDSRAGSIYGGLSLHAASPGVSVNPFEVTTSRALPSDATGEPDFGLMIQEYLDFLRSPPLPLLRTELVTIEGALTDVAAWYAALPPERDVPLAPKVAAQSLCPISFVPLHQMAHPVAIYSTTVAHVFEAEALLTWMQHSLTVMPHALAAQSPLDRSALPLEKLGAARWQAPDAV